MTGSQDLRSSLAELHQEMGRLHAQVSAAVHLGRATDGTDASGAVIIILGPVGAACDVHLAADWRRRVRAEQVGGAVVAADSDAAQRQACAIASAFGSTQDGYAGPQDDIDPPAAGGVGHPAAPAESGVRTRQVDDLTDLACAAFDAIGTVTTPPQPVAATGAGGAVRLRVERHRITACEIDPSWLNRQDDATLAHGLREALASATAARKEAERPAVDFSRRLTDLLTEVKAALHGMNRPI